MEQKRKYDRLPLEQQLKKKQANLLKRKEAIEEEMRRSMAKQANLIDKQLEITCQQLALELERKKKS